MTATHPTATLLRALADNAEVNIQPEARGKATANTLRELAALNFDDLPPVSPHELAHAFSILAKPGIDDAPSVAARRKTCAELADCVVDGILINDGPAYRSTVSLWSAFAVAVIGDGPRRDAIQETAKREQRELAATL